MKTIYLDIMVRGRFYRQVSYEYSPLFKIDFEDIIKHVMEKCPSLRDKKDVTIIEGKRVFNK
jgi:hypothetical protein